jgi:hypothetical protein
MEKDCRARDATDNIIQRMRIASWITKATGTHSAYAVLMSFPRQQWLREGASMLMFIRTFICKVCVCVCVWMDGIG